MTQLDIGRWLREIKHLWYPSIYLSNILDSKGNEFDEDIDRFTGEQHVLEEARDLFEIHHHAQEEGEFA